MTDVRAAKRALARLADPSPVTEAERALRDIDRAAAFRESGGLIRLRRTAERAGDPRARSAVATLAAFERFERAAAGETVDTPPDPHSPSSGSSSSLPVPDPGFESRAHVSYSRTRPSSGRHHFRRGRDTPLRDGG